MIEEGNNKILEIYKKLHSKILTDFKNPDMPKYIPHVTLGVFENEEDMNKVIKEIEEMNLEIEFFVDKISLLALDEDLSIKETKEFLL